MAKRAPLWIGPEGLPILSPSQINTFEQCPRKWAWNRINGIREPQGDAAALGEAVHDQLEKYLKHGTPIDPDTKAGQIALAGVQFLPAPKTPGMRVEEWFSFVFEGFVFRGKKDFEILKRDPRPLVSDHKTTKNFIWAKTPEGLEDDTQAAVYSADTMIKATVSEVDLQWTYFKTVGARSVEPVVKVMTEGMVERTMLRVLNVARNLQYVGENYSDAIEVPYNAEACEMFGGCYYADRCNLTPKEKLKSIMAQKNTQSLLEELRKKRQAKAAAGGTPTPTPTPTPSPVTTEGQAINPPDQPPPPPAPRQDSQGNWIQAAWDPGHQQWVFPPEEFPQEEPKVEAPPQEPAKPDKRSKKKATPAPAPTPTPAPAPVAAASNELVGVIVDAFAELVAEKVAEKVISALKE